VSLISDTAGFLSDLGKAVNGLGVFENRFGGDNPASQPPPTAPAPQAFDLKSVSPWVWVGAGGLALVLLLRR
jgi:hypothetical protein